MSTKRINQLITYFIASVWLLNGLFCKVVGLVPRHEEIVSKVLDIQDGELRLTVIAIGIAETLMGIWVLSRLYTRVNAVAQIVIIATMNVIEIIVAPDLLLWGEVNAVFAFLFIGLVFYQEFQLNRNR